jgi:very-short-patch-repair endonuclease
VALVELDDWSHDESRDALRDAMTDAAGYRTIRIPGNPRPTAESVRAAVTDLAHAYRAGPWRAGSQAASPEARRVME